MAARIGALDIDALPELSRIADEVAATGQPRTLLRGGVEIAVVQPIRSPRRGKHTPSAEDIAAFQAAAGNWQDVDTDGLLEDLYASRDLPPRPLVDL